MPSHPHRRTLALVATGAAAASTAALLAAGHPANAEAATSSAFGVSATGAVPLPPQPTVSSPDGAPASDSAPVASADGSVTATATVTAAAGRAEATVTDLSLLFGQVTAGRVTTTCRDGAGTVTISEGTAGDTPLPAAPTPGQAIPLGDTGSIELNAQTTGPDGTTTIVGLRATITTPGGIAETVSVASTTCAAATASPPPTGTPPAQPAPTPTSSGLPTSKPSSPANPVGGPTPSQPNRPAPAPVPVATHVAVTG